VAEHDTLSIQELELFSPPFGDLSGSPFKRHLNEAERPPGSIDVQGLRVRVGDRPIAINIEELYKAGHGGASPNRELFGVNDLWLIVHSVGAVQELSGITLAALGLDVSIEDEAQAHTIGLIPQPYVSQLSDPPLYTTTDLGVEGNVQPPDRAAPLLDKHVALGGATLTLSSAPELIGRIRMPVLTPLFQAVGQCASRCQWHFDKGQTVLLGDQTLIQTVMVRRFAKSITLSIRAYVMFGRSWLNFAPSRQTKWMEVRCEP
jgi:hypothetical protein